MFGCLSFKVKKVSRFFKLAVSRDCSSTGDNPCLRLEKDNKKGLRLLNA